MSTDHDELGRLATGRVGTALDWFAGPHPLSSSRDLTEEVAGKVVVLTGASFGLGAATARMLVDAGAQVYLGARTVESLEQIERESRTSAGSAVAVPLDLSDNASIDRFAETVLSRTDRIDVLIHNAGRSLRRSIDLSYDRPQDLESTTRVNYLGPMRLTLKLLPLMRSQEQPAHLVNISTIGVQLPDSARWGFYVSSKAAFDRWLRSVALEAHQDGVTLTTYYSGLMHTRMSAPSGWMRQMPGKTPDQAARAVARAIVDRPRVLSTSYGRLATLLAPVLRTPAELFGAAFAKRSGDTAAALAGVRGNDDEAPA